MNGIQTTYILPVDNGESWLETYVVQVLDQLAERDGRFELIIADDGSADETASIAGQLALTYPQVMHLRRETRFGANSAIQMGLRRASGNNIFVVNRGEDSEKDSSAVGEPDCLRLPAAVMLERLWPNPLLKST